MSLPANWTLIPVTWTLLGQDGTPCTGVVRFTSAQVVTASGGTYVPETIEAAVVNGVMAAVSLPSTDDPDISPTGWTWQVAPLVSPQGPDAFYMTVPAASGTINLATVVPVTSPAPVSAASITDGAIAPLIGDTGTLTGAAVKNVVDTAINAHTPGVELGYASRATNFTTTNTNLTSVAGAIPTLTLSVVGQGRPIDLRFYAATVYHSVANTIVNAVIVENGVALSSDNQIGATISPQVANGPSMGITRRTGILTSGTTYTYTVQVAGAAAGTVTMVGAAYCPIELSATSR